MKTPVNSRLLPKGWREVPGAALAKKSTRQGVSWLCTACLRIPNGPGRVLHTTTCPIKPVDRSAP